MDPFFSDMQVEKFYHFLKTRLHEAGYKLVQVHYEGPPVASLCIRAERADTKALTINECVTLTRHIRQWLEEDPLFQGRNYALEVSSPGLDRPLNEPADYQRFLLHTIAVKTSDKRYEGVLQEVLPDGIKLQPKKGESLLILWQNIKAGHLVPQLGGGKKHVNK